MIEVPNSPDAIIEHGQCPTHGILSRYTLLTLAVKCCASLKAQFNRHLAFAWALSCEDQVHPRSP